MKEVIDSSKKILIATGEFADFDKLCAAISLAKALHNFDKKVTLLIPDSKYAQRVIKIFPTMDIKLILKDEPDNFILSIPKDGAVVKDVKWKEEDGKINIYVTTEKGELEETQIVIKPNFALFDLIIVVGVANLLELGEFYRKNAKIFLKTKILQIGELQKKVGAHRFSEDGPVLSDAVYKFIESAGITSASDIFTDLLAGILWKTDGLNRVEDELITRSIADLVELGANIRQASKKAFRNLSLQDTRLMNEVLKNLEVGDGEILFSVIKASNKKGLLPEESISSFWALLDRIQKFQVGVILFERQEGVFGVVATKGKHSALDMARDYKPRGDKFMATFTTAESSEQIKTKFLGSNGKQGVKNHEARAEEKAAIEQEPLKAAEQTPAPLKLEDQDTASVASQMPPARGGFTPPPPINPLPPTE